jgi:PAS domain S-box-containing protein
LEALFHYGISLASGLALAIGLLSLYVGLRKPRDRYYLLFGLISISAALFYVARITGQTMEWPTWAIRSAYALVFLFYGLFPWFISAFTGFFKKPFNWAISIAIPVSYILLWTDERMFGPLPLWDWIAMMVVISIGIYGLLAAFHMRRTKTRSLLSFRLFSLTILVYNLLLVHYHIEKFLGLEVLFPRSLFTISLIDFFPLFFLVIMGLQLGRDLYERLLLERKLQVQDRYINNLLENLEQFVVLSDPRGHLLNANSFFQSKTGSILPELKGTNWIERFFPPKEAQLIIQSFDDILKGKRQELPGFNVSLSTPEGRQFQVSWSHVKRLDENDNVVGFLSIGYDLTEKEQALREIDQLRLELEKENLYLQDVIQSLKGQDAIIGESDSLKYALSRAYQVAPTDANVLIKGETGVGKELFAELVHQNSQRVGKPLIKVNCASLPRDLIESELFGHEKGAFTGAHAARKGHFEIADGGTLFLDEIGELPIELQPKLLRVLQQGEFMRLGGQKVHKVDVRLITATNRDLKEEVKKKHFREDLFYRLDVYPITIPPLRQRKEDIPMLVSFFVKKYSQSLNSSVVDISKRDLQLLRKYHWPGNVRELQNVVERALINSPEGKLFIDPADLENLGFSPKPPAAGKSYSVKQSLEEVEREHIMRVLEDCNWKISGESGAAHRLGVPRTTLQSRMKKLGIKRPKEIL